MNTNIKSVIAAASIAALTTLTASAQLITGNTVGYFSNPTGAADPTFTSLIVSTNPPNAGPGPGLGAPYGTQAAIYSGDQANPANSADVLSVTFNGSYPNQESLSLAATTPQAIATFTWTNGDTTVPTTATGVDFNLKLAFSGLGGSLNYTGLISLGLDLAGNQFTITSPTSGSFLYGSTTYKYSFSFDTNVAVIPEAGPNVNAANTNRLYITFQAVPEPSTYALFGVIALMGVVAVRRFRSSKVVA